MNADRLVGTVMHRGIIGCKPSTSLEEVIRLMADTNLRVIVVTGHDDEALGVISQLDVLPLYGEDQKAVRARDVMRTNVIAIPPDMMLGDAVRIMVDHGINHLVVSERGDIGLRALGILSSTQVIREMRGSKWMWYFSPNP